MTPSQPDTAQIRQKLDIAFDDSVLSAFSFDYFPEVYDRFSQGMRKDDKITSLLDYCRRQPIGFEKLLENVRKKYEMSHFQSQQLKPLIDALELYIELLPQPDSPQQRKDSTGRAPVSGKDTSTKEGTNKPAWLMQAVITVAALFFGGLIGGYMMSGGDQPPVTLISPSATTKPTQTAVPPSATTEPTQTAVPPSATTEPTDTLQPTATPALGIGSTIISDKDEMTLLYVPEGDFEMGSADNDPDADDDEKPRHTVFLDAYWIDQTEVTNAMFASFLNEMGNQEEGGVTWLAEEDWALLEQVNGSYQPKDGYADHPVVAVSWYGANAYCQWAERRLPTEAEWEKAAGGTDGRKWPWGNETPTGELANICDTNCGNSWKDDSIDDGYGRTSPVGNYPAGASPYGALDMAGNVWEWVADTYEESYYASLPKENPQEPTFFGAKVLRGGSWYDAAPTIRVRGRGWDNMHDRGSTRGFRCSYSHLEP